MLAPGWLIEKILLVDTYRVRSEFREEKFEDRYFEGLSKYIDERTLFLTQLYYNNWEKATELIEQFNKMDDMVTWEQIISLVDLIDILKYQSFCRKIETSGYHVDGVNINDLLKKAICDGISCGNSFWGLIKAKTVKLLANKKFDIVGVLGWYEGQPS